MTCRERGRPVAGPAGAALREVPLQEAAARSPTAPASPCSYRPTTGSILMKQISYYATRPCVSCILVTWHNTHLHPPNSTKIGHAFVHFLPQKEDSNNCFNPSQIATDGAHHR